MPTFDFKCEVCGTFGREWRADTPPRFCSLACKHIGVAGQTCKKGKYHITDEAHNMIREAYRKPTGNGEIKALAKKLGLPRWKITRHAQHNLWTKRTKRMPAWTKEEMAILKTHARHCAEKIQKELKKRGYHRTVVSIELKRKRLRLSVSCLDGYSANSLATCLGEDNHFVLNAIKNNQLLATRRETRRTKKQGGDIYWIKPNNARKWIIDNVNRIDLTKVDKYWFVDFISGAV